MMSLENLGFSDDVLFNTWATSNMSIKALLKQPADVFLLKAFNAKQEKYTFSEHKELAQAMQANIAKPSRQVRLQSLQVLSRFQVLKYSESTEEVSENYKDQPCPCIKAMLDFETYEISFETEKNKELELQRLEVIVNSGLMPREYLEMLYHFLVGCLWIKFTPIFDAVANCIAAVIKKADEELQLRIVE